MKKTRFWMIPGIYVKKIIWFWLCMYPKVEQIWHCCPFTLKTWYKEPQNSEFSDIVNQTRFPFWGFTKLNYIWYSELFNIVNKKGLTDLFTISRFECIYRFYKMGRRRKGTLTKIHLSIVTCVQCAYKRVPLT